MGRRDNPNDSSCLSTGDRQSEIFPREPKHDGCLNTNESQHHAEVKENDVDLLIAHGGALGLPVNISCRPDTELTTLRLGKVVAGLLLPSSSFRPGSAYRLCRWPYRLLRWACRSSALPCLITEPRAHAYDCGGIKGAQAQTEWRMKALDLEVPLALSARLDEVIENRRGETNRHDPTGMSRPHDRVWGGASASDPWEVSYLR